MAAAAAAAVHLETPLDDHLTAMSHQSWINSMNDTWLFRFVHNFVDYLLVIVPIVLLIYLVKHKVKCFNSVSQNRFVKLFVFGVDDELADKKLPLINTDLSTSKSSFIKNRYLLLAYCFFGLQISYLTWGLLQEKLMTQNYVLPNSFFVSHHMSSNLIKIHKTDPDSPVTYFTFQNSLFLVFMNRTVAFWIAICLLIHQNRKAANRSFFSIYQPPLYAYMYCSLSNILSSWCQYEALKYISFPVQVLSKGCKMIPVMIMSQCLRGKTHKRVEWLFALSISFGLSVFLLNEHRETKNGHSIDEPEADSLAMFSGLIILALYLTFDSFTSNWQSVLFDKYKMSTIHMMAGVNLYSMLFPLVSLLQQGEFFSALTLVIANPSLLRDCILFSICSTTGQLFIFLTISEFGAVVFTLISTFRQVFAILLSCIIYLHPVSFFGYVGIFIVFGSLFGKTYYNSRTKRPRT